MDIVKTISLHFVILHTINSAYCQYYINISKQLQCILFKYSLGYELLVHFCEDTCIIKWVPQVMDTGTFL